MLFTAPPAGETARKAWATSGVLRFWERVVRSSDCAARPASLFCGVSCCGVCLVSSLILCYSGCHVSNGVGGLGGDFARWVRMRL